MLIGNEEFIYNSKYDRYVSKLGNVYRYDKVTNEYVICGQYINHNGYKRITVFKPTKKNLRVHRLVWETFCGPIHDGYVIDHINTVRTDNRLENLRCVTVKENNNNPNTLYNMNRTDFSRKFLEHYGYSRKDNPSFFDKERYYYNTHNKICRWENKQ
jgi:hypothetical protein